MSGVADVPTAVAAKDALEGHCIYDGGFCKLHLSYSRHTDLNVKVLCPLVMLRVHDWVFCVDRDFFVLEQDPEPFPWSSCSTW